MALLRLNFACLCAAMTVTATEFAEFHGGHLLKEAWTTLTDQENGAYSGTNDAVCSAMCQKSRFTAESCPAFSLHAGGGKDGCTFGTVEDCSVMVDKNVANPTIKVMVNQKTHSVSTVTEVYAPVWNSPPGMIDDKGTQCSSLLSIPTPYWGDFEEHPILVNHKKGILACGGRSDTRKACQFWQPGDANWIPLETPMVYEHITGDGISLGDSEAIVVGNSKYENGAAVEIYENGAWSAKKDYPITIRGVRLIAKNRHEVYGFGGYWDYNWGLISKVYKYDRLIDTWTEKQDMLWGGHAANCGRIQYQDRDTVLCFGAEGQEAHMSAFDLGDETWTNLHRTAPAPPHYGSAIITLGTKLYRLGGYDTDAFVFVNTLDIFDTVTNEWEDTKTLPVHAGDDDPYDPIIMTLQVVTKN